MEAVEFCFKNYHVLYLVQLSKFTKLSFDLANNRKEM